MPTLTNQNHLVGYNNGTVWVTIAECQNALQAAQFAAAWNYCSGFTPNQLQGQTLAADLKERDDRIAEFQTLCQGTYNQLSMATKGTQTTVSASVSRIANDLLNQSQQI